MAKSRAEMMEIMEKLLADLLNFRTAVLMCLRAICAPPRKKNWISSSPNFGATERLKQTTLTDATETSVPLNVGWGIHLIRRLGLKEAEKSKLNGACRGSKLHSLLDR